MQPFFSLRFSAISSVWGLLTIFLTLVMQTWLSYITLIIYYCYYFSNGVPFYVWPLQQNMHFWIYLCFPYTDWYMKLFSFSCLFVLSQSQVDWWRDFYSLYFYYLLDLDRMSFHKMHFKIYYYEHSFAFCSFFSQKATGYFTWISW